MNYVLPALPIALPIAAIVAGYFSHRWLDDNNMGEVYGVLFGIVALFTFMAWVSEAASALTYLLTACLYFFLFGVGLFVGSHRGYYSSPNEY